MERKPVSRRIGFTLIEVLVVVAIIALLVSILLPSLAKAKEQARSAACGSTVAQICKANGMYMTEQKDWIPGSPLTTGYWWVRNWPSASWDPSLPGFNRFAAEWFDFTTPLRAQMYGAKSVPALGTAADTQKALWRQMTESPFLCPSNPVTYGPYQPPATGAPVIRATSYLTMDLIVRGGPATYHQYSQINSSLAYDIACPPDWEVLSPSGYMPRLDRLGRAQGKVFIADGIRYYSYDASSGAETMDYNCTPNDYHGVMCAAPPAEGWQYGREYNVAHKYSYRHGGMKDRINAGFFDGHVESLLGTYRGDDVPFTGRAVEPQFYYPSGSIVQNPAVLNKSTILAGTKLP